MADSAVVGPSGAPRLLSDLRRSHDHRADHFYRFVDEGDPLADAAVEAFAKLRPGQGRKALDRALSEGIAAVPDAPDALHALFEQLDKVPFWVDWETLDRGGIPFRRTGALGALIMGCYALPLAYSSGTGVKPLIFSGRLVHKATRRLTETALFNAVVNAPGGLKRTGRGFKTVVRVRMIHAQVRRLLLQSERWDTQAWGMPINQIDMAGSNLFFSELAIRGLRRLGIRFSRTDIDCALQLWRYSGYLSGIHPDLLCATESEALRLADLIMETRLQPDNDSRVLVQALMERAMPELLLPGRQSDGAWGAKQISRFCYGLSESLLGASRARELGYPRTLWRYGAPWLLRSVLGPTELLRFMIPGFTAFIANKTSRALHVTIERTLAGRAARYDMPSSADAFKGSNLSKPSNEHER